MNESCKTLSEKKPNIKNHSLYDSTDKEELPGGSVVKNPPSTAGDSGLICGSGRSPGGGNNNSLQNSSLGNPMDGGVCQATDNGVMKESDMTLATNQKFDIKHPKYANP